MDTDLVSFSGLVLMFVLGLRHGLDPDHIACIDGLTWRALRHEPSMRRGTARCLPLPLALAFWHCHCSGCQPAHPKPACARWRGAGV
jgi:hypothetical protein